MKVSEEGRHAEIERRRRLLELPEGYTGLRACEVAQISYRQLDYWARTALIRPSIVDARGSGSRRRYSYRDIIRLAIVKRFLDAGVRLETVRLVMADLDLPQDLHDAVLVLDPQPRITTAEEIPDLCRSTTATLTVLPLTSVRVDVDTALGRTP